MNNKNILKINNTVSKTFRYSKGETNLSFTLRVDIKQELKDFLELLEMATKQIGEEITKL